MKKIVRLAIMLILSVAAFAKEIPLKVTQTEWGFEISNLDTKGKRICKGFLDFQEQENIYIIFKNNHDTFSIENLARSIVCESIPNIVCFSGEMFLFMEKDKKNQLYGPLSNYDSILIVSSKGKIAECNAFSDGKNLHLRVFNTDDISETNMMQLIETYTIEHEKRIAEQKLKEEQLKKISEEIESLIQPLNTYTYTEQHFSLTNTTNVPFPIGEIVRELCSDMANENLWKYEETPSNCFQNEDYVFSFESSGNDTGVIIYKYNGDQKKVVIPKEIEGFPVKTIASWGNSVEEVVIPNTVTTIKDHAFICCGIKKVSFEKNSKLENIGKQAFAFNRLQTIDLPKKRIKIRYFAYFMNPIKEISIYKDWIFSTDKDLFLGLSDSYLNERRINVNTSKVPMLFEYYGMGLPLLEKVIFEEGVVSISSNMFYQSPNLKTVQFPSTLKSCGSAAFYNCYSLNNVLVPNNLKIESHWRGIFWGCNLDMAVIKKLLNAGFSLDSIQKN